MEHATFTALGPVTLTARPGDVRVAVLGQPGLGAFDAASREVTVRVRTALDAVWYATADVPERHAVDVQMPLGARQGDPGLDLPVALLAGGWGLPEGTYAFGEVGLGGQVRACRGLLLRLDLVTGRGARRVLVPSTQAAVVARYARQAGLDVEIRGVVSLAEAVEGLTAEAWHTPLPEPVPVRRLWAPSWDDVQDPLRSSEELQTVREAVGRRQAVLLVGPPGAGATMIARRLPGDLPSAERPLGAAVRHDLAGLGVGDLLDGTRPFRAPHHTVSVGAMRGEPGRPGEVDLARGGVLFLDEAVEFRQDVVETIRDLLRRDPEDAPVVVLAAHPCPCGGAKGCRCTPDQTARHRARLDKLRTMFGAVEVTL